MTAMTIMKNIENNVHLQKHDGSINKLKEKNHNDIGNSPKKSKINHELRHDIFYSVDTPVIDKTKRLYAKTVETFPIKKVTFALKNEVREVPLKTQREAKNMWYSNRDYQSFTDDCMRTVMAYHAALNNSLVLDPASFTIVGLEHDIKDRRHNLQRHINMRRHIYAVLKIQYDQRCKKTNNNEMQRRIRESRSIKNFHNSNNLMMNI